MRILLGAWVLAMVSACSDAGPGSFSPLGEIRVARSLRDSGRVSLEIGRWASVNGVSTHGTDGRVQYGRDVVRVCTEESWGPCDITTCEVLQSSGAYPAAGLIAVSSPSSFFRLSPPRDEPDGGVVFTNTGNAEPMWNAGESVLFLAEASPDGGGVPPWSASIEGP